MSITPKSVSFYYVWISAISHFNLSHFTVQSQLFHRSIWLTLRRKMAEISHKNKRLCGREKISLREEINFLPYENKFIYGRKFTGIREEIHGEERKLPFLYHQAVILLSFFSKANITMALMRQRAIRILQLYINGMRFQSIEGIELK